MKKVVTIIMVACLLFAFAACTQEAEPTENTGNESETANEAGADEQPTEEVSTEEEPIKIGILFCTAAAPSVKHCWETVEAYADTLPNVEVICLDAELDAQKQADQALNLISQEVDVIVINPADANSFASTAKTINEAGIPLITYVQPLGGDGPDYQTSFVGADDTQMGYQYVDKMVEIIGDTGNIVLVEGALGSSPQIVREAAILDYIEKNYPNLKVLDKQTTSWDRETGRTVMEDFLAKYDDIDGVIAWDDNIAIGCIEALEKVGKSVEIPVLGYVGIIDAIPYYESGALAASQYQPLGASIKTCVDVAVKIMNGEEVEEYYWDPVEWITGENLDEFTFEY